MSIEFPVTGVPAGLIWTIGLLWIVRQAVAIWRAYEEIRRTQNEAKERHRKRREKRVIELIVIIRE